jgi:hypothetical protein
MIKNWSPCFKKQVIAGKIAIKMGYLSNSNNSDNSDNLRDKE